MLVVYVWHTVFTHFQNLPKSQILCFCFQNYSKEQAQRQKRLLKEFEKLFQKSSSQPCPIHVKSNHHLKDLLFTTAEENVRPGKAFLISYLQNVATLNEAGISTPTGSVLYTVHYTQSVLWLACHLNSEQDLDCGHRQE